MICALVTGVQSCARPIFRDEVGRELVGSLPADDLVERLQRRGIIPAERGRDRGLHRAGLLPDRLGELSRRKAELLHQPEGFALLDRPRLLVVAKKKHARAGVVADLQDPLRLPAPELARLVDDQDMTIGARSSESREGKEWES